MILPDIRWLKTQPPNITHETERWTYGLFLILATLLGVLVRNSWCYLDYSDYFVSYGYHYFLLFFLSFLGLVFLGSAMILVLPWCYHDPLVSQNCFLVLVFVAQFFGPSITMIIHESY